MKDKTIRLGLIGKDVSASRSGAIHTYILKEWGYACVYEHISSTPADFDMNIRRLMGDFDGFNVTIPYKRDIMEYLDEVVGDAFLFSAVNTVVNGTNKGYNTDGVGFLLMTKFAGITFENKKILVIGGGGAGRSTAAVLKKVGGRVSMYQRNREHLSETCNELQITPISDPEQGGFDIVINATGVGMHDTVGKSPVGKKAFAKATVAIDLIYRPAQSEFLRLAKEEGLATLNGGAMLFYQAYYADCLFLGLEPDEEQAQALYQAFEIE